MSGIKLEWSPAKTAAHGVTHGVTRGVRFEGARTVFEDAAALLIADPDHAVGEECFMLLGRSSSRRVPVVMHCERSDGAVIRMISARKADWTERAAYTSRQAR